MPTHGAATRRTSRRAGGSEGSPAAVNAPQAEQSAGGPDPPDSLHGAAEAPSDASLAPQGEPEAEGSESDECAPSAAPADEPEPAKEERTRDKILGDLIRAVLDAFGADPPAGSDKKRDALVVEYLRCVVEQHKVASQYNILYLHDEGPMIDRDADNIYSAAAKFKEARPLLLILYSTGGAIGPAYLIGKLCREYSHGKFVVAVPRKAKSAATLICCAADEVHMGSLSELGPIDPQLGGLPALGLKASVEHIANMLDGRPYAAEMFAKYLHLSLQPIDVGYFERVAESAQQYAERLLMSHKEALGRKPEKIAHDLVYLYKDHGFVIDKEEATGMFGTKVVKSNTDEYRLANDMYDALAIVVRLADFMNRNFYLIGAVDSEPHWDERKRK